MRQQGRTCVLGGARGGAAVVNDKAANPCGCCQRCRQYHERDYNGCNEGVYLRDSHHITLIFSIDHLVLRYNENSFSACRREKGYGIHDDPHHVATLDHTSDSLLVVV